MLKNLYGLINEMTMISLQQKTLKDWEDYEGEKTNLIQYLKKAETELEKPPTTTGQELAQKDYTSKKVRVTVL